MYSAATPVLDLAGDQGSIDGSIDLYIIYICEVLANFAAAATTFIGWWLPGWVSAPH